MGERIKNIGAVAFMVAALLVCGYADSRDDMSGLVVRRDGEFAVIRTDDWKYRNVEGYDVNVGEKVVITYNVNNGETVNVKVKGEKL